MGLEQQPRRLVTDDGESRYPIPLGPEKNKRLPPIRQMLEEIYAYGDDDQKALLFGLRENATKFNELNGELREAKKEFRGCKLSLDTWYYGPSIVLMMNRLLSGNVSGATLPEAATFSAFMALMLLIFKPSFRFEEKGPFRTARERYADLKANVSGLSPQLEAQTKVLYMHLKMLELNQTQELKKPHQIAHITEEITRFFEDKDIEEQILREAKARLESDNVPNLDVNLNPSENNLTHSPAKKRQK
jgi:hypothetical protein